MKCLLGLLAVLAGTGTAFADDKSPVTFTVTGGKQDLTNVIVRVPVPAKALAGFTHLRVQSDRELLLAQNAPPRLLANVAADTSEVTFRLPLLKAGDTKTLRVLTNYPVDGAPKAFHWKLAVNEHADLFWGDQPMLRYMYAPLDDSSKEKRELTYKVYHHAFAPGGEPLLTKGPGGLYTHHRGLFYAFNKVSYGEGEKADVWHCTNDAHQSHRGFEQAATGEVFGRHRIKIGWHGVAKAKFAEELRELTAFRVMDRVLNGTLIEFASELKTTGGKVRLDGDPQHSGFHFRAAQEVADQVKDKKPQTYFLRPDGKGKIGEERNWDPKTKKGPVNLPWNAMSFVLGDKRYTAVYLDHPDNPKEARISERVYGRFGSYFEYDLTEDKPLRVQYRIWVQPGEMTVEQCEALSQAFVEPVKVEVK